MTLPSVVLPCDPLPDLSNVTALTHSVGRSTCHPKAYFSCSPCYHLIGSPNITCLENGNWTGGVPTCEREASQLCFFLIYVGISSSENV